MNTEAAAITAYDFQALDLRQLATTTVTLTWLNTQIYPKDLTVLIYTDPEQIEPVFEEDQTSVPCVFS